MVSAPLLSADEQAEAVFRAFLRTRMEFGLKRLELGAHLHIIRENKLWQGRAESWEAFIAEQNLNPNAVRQYISAARKFVFDLNLPEATLCKLSLAGMTALEKAARVITADNQEEIVGALTSLSERDAVQRIIELSATGEAPGHQTTLRVLSLLKQYHSLPPDLQSEFKQRLGVGSDGHSQKAAA